METRPTKPGDAPAKAPALEIDPEDAPLRIFRANCKLCNHPNRQQIEQDFANYVHNVAHLVKLYPDLSFANFDNHFTHSGLRAKRDEDLLHPLRLIVDRGLTAGPKLTGETIIRAVELQAKITGKLKPDNTVNIVNILNTLDDSTLDTIEAEATVEDPAQPD